MADPNFEALILGLNHSSTLLPVGNLDKISLDAAIKDLQDKYDAAKTKKEKDEIYGQVSAVAKGLEAAAGAAIGLSKAVKSGDPFAISAQSLAVAAALVAMVGVATGPIGAAVGAIVGALLSIVSMILGLFQKESESLITQIEKVVRTINAEKELEFLRTAKNHLSAFSDLATKVNERNAKAAGIAVSQKQDYTPEKRKYSFIKKELSPDIMTLILSPANWLDHNKDVELWAEVLSLVCQLYYTYRLSIESWLPLVAPADSSDNGERARQMLLDWRDEYNNELLKFINGIKPAVQNRGLVFHAGERGIYVRDMVMSSKAEWTNLGGDTHAIAAAYRPGQQVSANPLLSILHLGDDQKFISSEHSRNKLEEYSKWSYADLRVDGDTYSEISKAIEYPFSKKTRTFDMNGKWNGERLLSSKSEASEWKKLDLGETYDIWAIPGISPGEISVYTSTGNTIKDYVAKGEVKHVRDFERVEGHTVGSVRAVRTKTQAPSGETDLNWNLAVYGLCDASSEIVVFAPPPKLKGRIWTPPFHKNPEMRWGKYPVGITVDSVRLWAFGTSWIACVTHEAVKQCLPARPASPAHAPWTVYNIPKDLLGYDPAQYVSWGLCDLSACDDGTLTAIMQDKNKDRRIFTAATQFVEGLPIIKPGQDTNLTTGDRTPTHGWQQDPQDATRARRIHKLPIFCWPMIEGLESALKAG
jgi:hypothetical protein